MELTLYRTNKARQFTEGRLMLNGFYFCDTLEPTWRDIGWGGRGRKIMGQTAIPNGRYAVVVTRSPKFKRWLPLLLNVPLFTGIRIHEGNEVGDTAGCILLGYRAHEGRLIRSRHCVETLVNRMAHRSLGEPIWISVTDEPLPRSEDS